MRWAALAAVLIVVLATLAGTAQRAHAHAQLVRSMPDEGAVVAAPPPVLALHFNEPVRPATVRLLGPDGAALDAAIRGSGVLVEVVPAAPLAQGAHLLSYRVVSADGHPVAGAVSFAVGARSDSPVATSGAGTIWIAAVVVARALAYGGLLFGIGGAAAVAWLGPAAPSSTGPARRVARLALVAGALGYAGGLLLLGHELADGWDGALQAAAATSLAGSAALWAVAAVAAAMALSISAPGAALLASAATLGGGAALALTGHAATAPPAWIATPAVALHGIAASLWAGSLPLIATAAARRDASLPAVLRRFSTMAVIVVAVLAVAGSLLVALQLRSPSDLLDTAYGRVLLAKLAIVAALLALAAWNRFRLTPAVCAGSTTAAPRLRASVLAEIALLVALVVVVAAWRFTPPPRAMAPAGPEQRNVHLHGAEAMVDVVLSPGLAGRPGRLTVVPMQPDFAPLAAKEIVVTLSRPADGIEGLERKLSPTAEGPWTAEGVTLPLAGRWSVRVDLLVTDFDKLSLEGEIDVAPARSP